MYEVGSVIIVENQVFDLGKNNERTQIDHSKVRPALIIAEDDENFYYVTLTSQSGSGCVGYQTNEMIRPNGKIKYNKEGKIQFVQIKHIYSKKIYGAVEITALDDEVLYNILVSIYNFHNSRDYNNFDKIEKNILMTIKKLAEKLNKPLDKK